MPTFAAPITFGPNMSAILTTPNAALLPTGLAVQPAGPVLRQIGQAMGLPTEPPTDLLPWLQEDTDAFERSIEEVCEQIKP